MNKLKIKARLQEALASLETVTVYLVFLARLLGPNLRTRLPSQEKSPSTLGEIEKAFWVASLFMSCLKVILIGEFVSIPDPLGI